MTDSPTTAPDLTNHPEATAQLPHHPKRWSRGAIIAFVVSTALPTPLYIGDWILVSHSDSMPQSGNWLVFLQFVAGIVPLCGLILGIVFAAVLKSSALRGRGLAVASIVSGGVTLLLFSPFEIGLLLLALTVNHVG